MYTLKNTLTKPQLNMNLFADNKPTFDGMKMISLDDINTFGTELKV